MNLTGDPIENITSQASLYRKARQDVAREYIQKALNHINLTELIEIATEIYEQQFILDAIADHHTTQQQMRLEQ